MRGIMSEQASASICVSTKPSLYIPLIIATYEHISQIREFLSLAVHKDITASFESNNLWIKLVQLCPEGELACDKVIYIGLNKKTGDFITLQGKTVISKRNSNFYIMNLLIMIQNI